jgi:hypothetical protein
MATRTSRAEALGLIAMALLGAVGGSVFGVLASEGGRGHLRNIVLGVVCAIILVSVTAIHRFIDIRFLRAGGIARERAVQEREHAAPRREEAERHAAEVQVNAETQVITGLRARLSPVLYSLGRSPRLPRGRVAHYIVTAVMAGESPAGILTLDAPKADSLGESDLEIMKTLASLLGVGLALGAHTSMPRLQVPAQGNRELP